MSVWFVVEARRVGRICLVGCLALVMVGCETAYYGIQEKLGNLKNDILIDRVEEAMASQEDAKEEFKSAFDRFESVVGIPDGDLKKVYRDLNNAFEDAESGAEEVTERIASVEDVAEDLFEEWEDEIGQISNASLRRQSQTKLKDSKRRYGGLITAMKQAESRMEPVLTSFRDHVLFLKHNLNAQAISSLKGELVGIESNVGKLIRDMEQSIAQAQSFLTELES